MPKKLDWEAYTNQKRIQVIEEIKEGISMNDGCIVNFNMFSDLALSLSIEIDENKITGLYGSLNDVLNVSGFEPENINQESKKERLIFMNISFGQGSGDLKLDIPAVPG